MATGEKSSNAQSAGLPEGGLSQSQVNADLFLYWQETWNKAVAAAWRDPQFASDLVDNPKKALFDRFGFVFRENIDLSVVTVPENGTDPSGKSYGWQTGADGPDGWTLPPTAVKFYLPPAPEASEQAVAVMAYWETGEALPFSTFCFC